MKKLGITWHFFYRFPLIYLGLLAFNAIAWKWTSTRGFPAWLASLITFLFTVVLLYSMARVAVIFERKPDLYEGEKTKKEKFLFLWGRRKTKLAMLLFLLLPLPYPAFRPVFVVLSPIWQYLCSRLILPFLFLGFFLGSMTGLTWHELNEKKTESKRKKIRRSPFSFLFHTYKYIPIYIAAAVMFLALQAVIFSLPGIVKLFITTSLGGAIIITIAVLWFIRIRRAILIRRKFLSQLSDACASQNIPMPKIHEPIRSLFRKKERGTVFEISLHNRTYKCKVISTLKPITMYRFYPSGVVGHVHTAFLRIHTRAPFGAMLFRQRAELYEKKYDVSFEAEEGITKIFIFNPCSKIVEGQFGSESLPLDNGMKIGEYTFYTASGFTGAIRRDCLHRKANE